MTPALPSWRSTSRPALLAVAMVGVGYALVFAFVYSPKTTAATTSESFFDRSLQPHNAMARLRAGNWTAASEVATADEEKEEEEIKEVENKDAAPAVGVVENREKNDDDEPLVGGSLWRTLDAELRARPDFENLTSTQNVRAFRSPEEMTRAQACFHKFKGYAYLLHMRKAGGTTLRNYLSAVVEKERDHLVYVSEGNTFNVSCFRDQGELVTLTSLRHPMTRILSSYWYEGRYDAHPPPLVPGTSSVMAAAVFNQSAVNASLPASFPDWVRFVRQNSYLGWSRASERKVWHCVDSYYIQTLTNRYRRSTYMDVGRHDFELAKRVLASFDVVAITEWMGWANQTAYIQHALGEERTTPTKGLCKRNKLSKAKNDSEIDRDTFAELWRANTWDILLYEFARNLVQEQLAAFEQEGGMGNAETEEMVAETQRRRQQGDELECRSPLNDPRWRKNPTRDYYKPNPDSFLYVMPYCMNAYMEVEKLGKDLW